MILPVGLFGVLTMMARVRGVIAARTRDGHLYLVVPAETTPLLGSTKRSHTTYACYLATENIEFSRC